MSKAKSGNGSKATARKSSRATKKKAAKRTVAAVGKTLTAAARKAGPKPANVAAGMGTRPLAREMISPKVREAIQSRLMAANFGNIVTVLMQTPGYENLPLGKLRPLVTPPLLSNQFSIAEAHKKGSGNTIPVGLALWARVSKEIDERLTNEINEAIRLAPDEWTSGDNLWLVEVVGDQRFVTPMLQNLCNTVFKGKTVKFRTKDDTGKHVVKLLQPAAKQAKAVKN